MEPAAQARRPLLFGAGVCCIALVGSPDWRLATLAALAAALCTWTGLPARGVVALLAAAACREHTWSAASSLALLALGLVGAPRSAWARRLVPGFILAAAALGIVHRGSEAVSVLVVMTLALVPLEGALGRQTLALGLLLAAFQGGIALWRAESAAESLSVGASTSAISRAAALAQRAGLRNLESRDRLVLAQSLAGSGAFDEALATMLDAPQPLQPSIELAVAQIEIEARRLPQARLRLNRLATMAPGARAHIDERTSLLWSRELLRRGHRREAMEVLPEVASSEAAELRRLASATEGPERAMSFAGAIRLTQSPMPHRCVERGQIVTFTWSWEVQTGFSPGEDDFVFIHVFGPKTVLGADHLIDGRFTSSLRPGERLTDVFRLPVPLTAVPGSYTLNVGLYDPGNQLRLQPLDRPDHQSYEEMRLEVCP